MPLLTDREVDDELAADWKEISAKHATPDLEDKDAAASEGEGGDTETVTADEPAKGERDAKPAADDKGAADDRPRDKTGRYKPLPKAAKDKGGEAAPAADRTARTDTQAAERAGQQPAVAQPQSRDVTRAPSTWSPKERAAWANVPQEARAAIHRREADFLAGQSQLLPDAQFGAEMRQTIAPYQMLIDAEGGTPTAAVLDLLRTAAIFRTGSVQQKYATLASIANRFGLDLRLFAPRGQGQQPQPVPPQQEFRDPRVDQLLHNMQSEQQQRAATEQRDAETLVSRWMNEADAAGKARRPYANDVIDAMSVMIPQIKAANPGLAYGQILDAAYEAAIWANPEIRQLLQTQQQTANDATRRAESQRRADAARRGASVNVPRRAGAPRRPQTGSMEDTIAETARSLGLITS